MARDDWQLCKELSRFLYSLDHTGAILQTCLAEAGALPPEYAARLSPSSIQQPSEASQPPIRRSASVPVTLADASKITSVIAPPATTQYSSSGAAPFQRTGATAKALHYRMSSGSGLGLGTLLSRVGTPPGGDRLRPLSRSNSRRSSSTADETSPERPKSAASDHHAREREADDDDADP
jgi:hypothetical protein